MIAPFLAAALFTMATGTPVSWNMQLHEKRDSAPTGFVAQGAAPSDAILDLRIALTPSNPAGLEDALYDVSSPTSANFRKYLTKEGAASFVAPAVDTVSAVNAWLAQNGLNATTLTFAGDWLGIQVPVSQANDLFNADFTVFKYESTNTTTIRTLAYSIPAALNGHIAAVHPTTSFITPTASKQSVKYTPNKRSIPARLVERAGEVNSSCLEAITPACLQQLYGIPTTPATQNSSTFGVMGYLYEWPQTQDVQLFLSNYRTDISSNTTYTLVELDGGEDEQNPVVAGEEADLDVEYAIGLATGVEVIFFSVGNADGDDLNSFMEAMDYLLAESDPPATLTTSYGFFETEVSDSIATNLCNAYAQLGARGTSVLFSSGDGGVSGTQSISCTTFLPSFPSGCPYVTSVGATTGFNPEIAAPLSGGGFSNIFATPSYQADAVAAYLETLGSTYSGLYNASGRGYPDVSLQGLNFLIAFQDGLTSVNGTSCATPSFASVIALLNDELAAAGQPALGFLNPWLYSTAAAALNDITVGSNPGCNTSGFAAGPGWDPVTGLGTPVYPALRIAAGL